MKKLLIALAAVLVTVASYGQGQVNFANRVGSGGSILDAPVMLGETGHGPGPDYSVQLYLVGANNSLTPLTPVSTFNPPAAGAGAIADRYWKSQTVDVPGVVGGTSANFQVRAWLTSAGSYDAASALGRGQSDVFAATVGGVTADPSAPPLTPGNLTGLKGFSVAVPEPSIIALGVLGASALLLRRRK
jgi:hypothetical protein